MSSGSYFPPPVLRVEIPKSDGGARQLGISTISDRIAQAAAKRSLEPQVEPVFHEDSYGFSPGRFALDALAKARQRCWRDNWILDLDISKFFDTLDHGLVMRTVRRFSSCKWVLLYIERWLKADVVLRDGTLLHRDTGTPQGGVISPLLANIFLHLGFDQWMMEKYPNIHFELYADDIVVHCRSRQQLEMIKHQIERRLEQCKLRLNPEKTRIVYCKDSKRTGDWHCYSFDFLGYTFRPRSSRNYRGEFFVSFSPAISQKSARRLRQTIRCEWKLKARTHLSLDDLVRRINSVVTGWINYYGKFCRSALHSVLNHVNMALAVSRLDDKSRMSREAHVRFCESVTVQFRCATRPVMESFVHTLKTEHVYFERYQSSAEAKSKIFDYIEVFYNRQRKHSTLGYQAPLAFEEALNVA